ncbi:hypothetical protein DY000_02014330 [Brassica cretica]|uniref:Uncharacterized protein n=1 Tax=Brassica cretica TaxID=69181 RepID=A0ABQ7CQM1_BRACR|nr:hypothetical protein DY000_02014330 [Brassica cretica]
MVYQPTLQIYSKDLEKTYDGLYEILQHREVPLRGYIACFNQEKVAIPECSIPTAISAIKRGLLPDGDLYKELTKYQCKTMEDVLSRTGAQVKWEEDVASRAKAQLKQEPKAVRPDRTSETKSLLQDQPGIPGIKSGEDTKTDRSRRQKGGQCPRVKLPQKMKAPDSFWNPGLWCVARSQKGHLREFLSEKAKSHLSKETTGKPTEAAPQRPSYTPPPRLARAALSANGPSSTSSTSVEVGPDRDPLVDAHRRLIGEVFLLCGQLQDMVARRDLLVQQVKASARWELMKEWLEKCIGVNISYPEGSAISRELTDPCHIRRFGNQRYKPCSLKEEHLERQARPRGSQAKMPAPGYGRNKLHGQGAGKGSHPTSRLPSHIAHCSELSGKKDTGR